MKQRLKVALWGVGAHARKSVIPALTRTAKVQVIGVYSRDPRAREEAALLLDARPYRDVTALLDDESEVVYVALPPALHVEAGLQIISSGKHLWSEKPLAPALQDSTALFDAAQRHDRGIFEGFMFKYHNQSELLRRIVASGSIGRLITVSSVFGIPHLPASDHRYQVALGGGALNDAGVYTIAFSRLWLTAGFHVRGAALASEPGFDVDTRGSMLVESVDGVFGIGSWAFGGSYRNEAILWGSEGVVVVQRPFSKPADLATELLVRRPDGSEDVIRVAPDDQFANMLGVFADAVQSGGFADYTMDARDQALVQSAVAGAGQRLAAPHYGANRGGL